MSATATDSPTVEPTGGASAGASRVLEVGCGTNKTPGAVGLDLLDLPGVDIVHDLEHMPWPVERDGFDQVRCMHVLEHVRDICGVMDELHRVTAPGGRIHIVVPYFANHSAFKDPTHVRFCTYGSFDYFVEGMKDRDRVYSRHAFRYVKRELIWRRGWRAAVGRLLFGMSRKTYERYWAHLFPARLLEVELEPVPDAGA